MNYYRFYQCSDKSPWTPLKDSPDVEARARANGAVKLTILAVSALPTPETGVVEEAHYRGPLYFDIDFPKDDRLRAIASAQTLVSKLDALGVAPHQLAIYCSGGKGFHVIVDEKLFSTGRALKDLPAVYREMALALHVDGMDFTVYRTGRGCSWRLANVERADGRYRVPITPEELAVMTPEMYAQWTQAPREQPPPPRPEDPVPGLEALFEQSKVRARTVVRSKAPPVEAEELAPFAEDFLPCIKAVREGDRQTDATFNGLALQVAIFIVRAGVEPGIQEALLTRFCERQHSNQYPSAQTRASHVRGLVKYVAATDRYQFSCPAMRAVLGTHPCAGCPLQASAAAGAQGEADRSGIFVRDGGYWRAGETPVPLSNFTLELHEQFPQETRPGRAKRMVAMEMELRVQGESLGTHLFNPGMWNSRTAFVKALEGFFKCAFKGSDRDVQSIKEFVESSEFEPGEIMRVAACGIHRTYCDDDPLWVYVEPGYSINSARVGGTHCVDDQVMAPPRLAQAVLPDPDSEESAQREAVAEVERALEALAQVNTPAVVGVLLGWFVAAHFRPHFMEVYRQFPLLNLWGASGTGKSSTAELFLWLSGNSEETLRQPVDASSTSRWAMTAYLSSSTSIVRPLEEFNKPKLSAPLYTTIEELLKASFNGSAATRGAVGRGANAASDINAHVTRLPINGPILYLSEQTTTTPALAQRTVQVQMTPAGLAQGREAYPEAKRRCRHLPGLAKLLMYVALIFKASEAAAYVEQNADSVPETMGDRPRYAYQVVLAGLDLLEAALTLQGMTEFLPRLNELRMAVRALIHDQATELTHDKQRSEVDEVLEDMALMAHLSEPSHGGIEWLSEGRHFHADSEYLYLDVQAAHAIYKRFKRLGGITGW